MENHNALISKLLNCAMACENCAAMCLAEEDVKMMADCISTDRDCADVCMLAASLLQRKSGLALQYLAVCKKACRICAEECSKHEHAHCQACAAACIECAEACGSYH